MILPFAETSLPPSMTTPLRFIVAFILAAIPVLPAAAAGMGIVIHKDQPFTEDVFAVATEYRDYSRFDAVSNFVTTDNTKLALTQSQLVRVIPYPSPQTVANILREADLAPLNAAVAELADLIKKYPRSAKFLNPRLRLFQGEIARLRAGQVKFEGAWLPTRKAYDDLLAARKVAVEAQLSAEKRQAEALRMEEEKQRMQAASGLAAAEAAQMEQARLAQEAKRKMSEEERKAEELRKIEEEKRLAVARLAAQRQEEERLQRELRIAEEQREVALLRYTAGRLKKADQFRRGLSEPVFAK